MQRGSDHVNGGNGAHDKLAADAFDFQVSGALPVKRQTNNLSAAQSESLKGKDIRDQELNRTERLTIPGNEGGWLLRNGGQMAFFLVNLKFVLESDVICYPVIQDKTSSMGFYSYPLWNSIPQMIQ